MLDQINFAEYTSNLPSCCKPLSNSRSPMNRTSAIRRGITFPVRCAISTFTAVHLSDKRKLCACNRSQSKSINCTDAKSKLIDSTDVPWYVSTTFDFRTTVLARKIKPSKNHLVYSLSINEN